MIHYRHIELNSNKIMNSIQENLMCGLDRCLALIIEDNLKNGTASLDGLAEEMIETWTTLSKDQREDFKKISPLCAEVMEKAIS